MKNLEMFKDIELNLRVEVGAAKYSIEDILKFKVGDVVELNSLVGQPFTMYVEDKAMALGEIVTMDDNFGFYIKEILSENPESK